MSYIAYKALKEARVGSVSSTRQAGQTLSRRPFTSVASMKASTLYADGLLYDLILDGRLRTYQYDAASTATANDGDVIKPTAVTTGRYLQVL